jgi:1,4-dihydroxy-2-naphthoyl-CoA synthase
MVVLLLPHNSTQKNEPRMQASNNAINSQLIKNECESRIGSFISQFGIASIARNTSIKKARTVLL